ncbi:uncharacterized protein PADG_07975 [Paracoccidioides brasiliensis Pb18]|uniref:Uncharacterized protein n=1 Tax=Paracoccidioides brasiliensis (strain Pb18) TaxID=502780 RepID=C1GKW8_PARBD|nr:uncharacterized protein PADG_07975 [Paracoccidioides brasiliensis Pb18]EEH43155.2 hypothetical protein PADG_07975 [Paracoccidioides brasiliensis Pb18]
MPNQSNQDSYAAMADPTTRQTRSQTQKNRLQNNPDSAAADKPKPSVNDFIANGPQIPEVELPPKVSREEIDAQVKELNNKLMFCCLQIGVASLLEVIETCHDWRGWESIMDSVLFALPSGEGRVYGNDVVALIVQVNLEYPETID